VDTLVPSGAVDTLAPFVAVDNTVAEQVAQAAGDIHQHDLAAQGQGDSA
jgi:hypothetical protein